MAKYKVLKSVVGDSSFKLIEDGGIKERAKIERKDGTYYAGDIIESDKDLMRLVPGRFEQLSPHGQDAPPTEAAVDDNISAMSVPELKAFAAEHKLDIEDATLKADIAATIRRKLVNEMVPAGT